jgi:4-amino-4-deoxy-L-arabinose transferase-like glycosyltransferase
MVTAEAPSDGMKDEVGSGPARAGWRRRLWFWRSPEDQPRWARPALLGLAALAGLAYGWQMGSSIEIYYAAAVRSMSMSWHDFVFAAFDPAGTISIDKLPGAFWVQALSVRIFGVHTWAVALPQVLEGALTILVLYRAVRRLAGPVAALAAAGILAVSPAVVALDRGNISDTLLVLLLVLAADSAVAALQTGRWRSVVMAGVWVGLAFQAKMIEAWLVVPALAALLLIASAGTLRARLLRVTAMVAIVGAVSFSWMLFVTLTPASHRPYVDGSQHNSVFEQVFDYNGFGRVGQPSPNVEMGRTLGIKFLSAPEPGPTWNRLLSGYDGRDAGWLLPGSLLVVAVGLPLRRGRPRTDPVRAGILLWGTWLVVFGVVFTLSATINTYYLAALAPAVAGLLGIAAKLVWDGRHQVATRAALIGVVLLTAGYAVWLLPDRGTGLPTWLRPTVVGLGVVATVSLVVTLLARSSHRQLRVVAVCGVGLAALLVPAVASESVVTNTLGPFDSPFQPVAATQFTRNFFGTPLQTISSLPTLEQAQAGAPDLIATQTSVLAAPFIYATGQEVLPIGGYTGRIPEPTVSRLASLVATGAFHLVITAASSADPRIAWVAQHCLRIPTPPDAAPTGVLLAVSIYYCTPPRARVGLGAGP